MGGGGSAGLGNIPKKNNFFTAPLKKVHQKCKYLYYSWPLGPFLAHLDAFGPFWSNIDFCPQNTKCLLVKLLLYKKSLFV